MLTLKLFEDLAVKALDEIDAEKLADMGAQMEHFNSYEITKELHDDIMKAIIKYYERAGSSGPTIEHLTTLAVGALSFIPVELRGTDRIDNPTIVYMVVRALCSLYEKNDK